MKGRITRILPLAAALLAMNSCVGLSADITVSADGSGRIALEYRVSQAAQAIGRLEGNARWEIIPSGRADMERTAARIPGMRLASFSQRADSRDVVNTAVLEFDNIEALLFFLNPSGALAPFERGGDNALGITIMEGNAAFADPALLALVRQASEGYEFSLSFSGPGQAELELADGRGQRIDPPQGARAVQAGRRVSFAMPVADILEMRQGLAVRLFWAQ